MNPIRFAMLSALLSPLVAEDDDMEQEPGAQASDGSEVVPPQPKGWGDAQRRIRMI